MEIALQGESRGIHYEGWEKTFIQCVFEEGEVQGRNERYEFRCDSKLECCGRVCCTPQQEIIPLWLMFLFIALALLLLLAILGTIAYLCAKRRKEKPKKLKDTSSNVAYASLSKDGKSSSSAAANGDRALLVHDSENYSMPDYYRTGGDGYRNDGYGRDGFVGADGGYGRDGYGRSGGGGGGSYGDQYGRYGAGGPGGPGGYGGGGWRQGDDGGDGGSRHGVTETFESSYKEEIVYEKAASVDSRERL